MFSINVFQLFINMILTRENNKYIFFQLLLLHINEKTEKNHD